jgi:phosphomannomutase
LRMRKEKNQVHDHTDALLEIVRNLPSNSNIESIIKSQEVHIQETVMGNRYEAVQTGAVSNIEISEGAMMRDQYNVNQAGAVGPGSIAHHISFTQTWKESDVDLPALKEELATLRAAMRKEANEPAHDMAVAEIASAEMAAEKGDGPSVLEHLAKAGRWALGIATAIGAALAAEVIKKAIGV